MRLTGNFDLLDIVIRYALIFCFGLGNLYIFYFIFTPLTYEVVFFVTSVLSDAILFSDGVMVNGVFFSIVSACVGGSAYYLLFILVFSTRGIKLLKRLRVLLFLFGILFLFNVCRILFMIYIYGVVYFDAIHWIFWYFISTVFVFLEWVLAIKVFNIKQIPIYSDLMFIVSGVLSGGVTKGKKIGKKIKDKGTIKKSFGKKKVVKSKK